jgi:transcriptional regulator with XRE-family HTH domain
MSEERKRIGAQLAARRRENGWGVRDVAARTGRQPSRISEMETGRANSSLDALVQIGEVLGMRLVYVPECLMADVDALLARIPTTRQTPITPRSAFDEVFIPDPEDDDETADH